MIIDTRTKHAVESITPLNVKTPAKPLGKQESEQAAFCFKEIGYLEQCLVRAENDSQTKKIITKINDEIKILKMLFEGMSVNDVKSQLEEA
jgi:hypothetical protein